MHRPRASFRAMTGPAERPRWERRANFTKSPIRAVGGHLRVFGDTLVFSPHAADRALFARDWAAQLSEIAAIGTASRDLRHLFGGGLRTRLAIELRDGRRELFVVGAVEQVAAELRELAGLPPHS
jgi:hypothetical protein